MLNQIKKEKINESNKVVVDDGSSVVLQVNNENKGFVICDMCGHSNPIDAALCVMCSNYLEK